MGNDKVLKFWRRMGQSIVALSNEELNNTTSYTGFMPSGGTIGYIFPVVTDSPSQGDHHVL